MSTAQFQKRTSQLDMPGEVYDLYQHVVMTCLQFNRAKTWKISRERFRAHGSWPWISKDSRRNFGTLDLIGWDNISSHSIFMQEHFSIRKKFKTSWMDGHIPDRSESNLCRFDFPPSSRYADVSTTTWRDLQRTIYTMAEPIRHGCTIVQETSFGNRWHNFEQSGPHHSDTDHSCPFDAQGGDREKCQDNSKR